MKPRKMVPDGEYWTIRLELKKLTINAFAGMWWWCCLLLSCTTYLTKNNVPCLYGHQQGMSSIHCTVSHCPFRFTFNSSNFLNIRVSRLVYVWHFYLPCMLHCWMIPSVFVVLSGMRTQCCLLSRTIFSEGSTFIVHSIVAMNGWLSALWIEARPLSLISLL